MTEMPGQRLDFPCREFVALVTEYLEDALDPGTVDVIERHLALCPHCREYLAEILQTMAALGRVMVEALSQPAQSGLIEAFRNRRRP